ncbi:aromatic ring-hydroxylating oxygenase subunit alpha [Coralliovum pocilloporae]|uniref:aromatic ring-hydroxylating oxygenase subunit alpha n=1 Tax=Coralliovum pocilloporae TaxID=3066369 RepID=UPI003306D1AB
MNMSADLCRELKVIASVPEDEALSLSGHHYSNSAYFEYERQTVLRKSWHVLGRVDELPEAGDYFTTQVLDEPLLIVRGDDGRIRVLSNVCRHRFMPVAEGAGNRKRFTCRYHAWSYKRDGSLFAAPRIPKERLNPEKCGLPEFRSEIWQGFIYVTLDPDAESLSAQLGDLDKFIGHFEPERMQLIHMAEEVWNCNWKCLIENFMEAYHLSVVHKATLLPYTPTELSRKAGRARAFTSYIAHYPETAERRFKGADGLSEEDKHQSRLFCVFPTHLASHSAGLLVSLSLKPEAVDKVRVRWTMSMHPNDIANGSVDRHIALWTEVNREDREKLEAMQSGLASSTAHSGPLAPADLEGTIWDFYQYLSEHVEDVESSGS